MEPQSAAGSFISLNERERRYYAGLHRRCLAAGGALEAGKVKELLQASRLPPEALLKVTELCGAKRIGHFNTTQFFIAMKLLAAAQYNLPINLETTTTNLPLPRFSGLQIESEMPDADVQEARRADRRHLQDQVDSKDHGSPPRSSPAYHSSQYSKRRTGADSLTAYESRPMVPSEQLSSPGGYRTRAATTRTSLSERLDQLGPDDSDPWRITEEQLEYYTNQFRSLQPDLGALILGTVAKNFFTKSKLPIPELSHIWELSDVDRDGALSFPEFCSAFHLIVARKNGFPLPERLPPTLRTGLPATLRTGLPATLDQDPSESAAPLIVFEDAEPRPSLTNRSVIERDQPGLTSTTQDGKDSCKQEPRDPDPRMRTRTRPRSYSSTSVEEAMKKTEEPPTPPPRPQKTHSRASSLDLNQLFQQGAPGIRGGWFPPPAPPPAPAPALPPRPAASQVSHFIVSEKTPQNKVQQPNFADFSRFREEEESVVEPGGRGPRSRSGASSEDLATASQQVSDVVSPSQAPQKPVRRRYHAESRSLEATPPQSLEATPPQSLEATPPPAGPLPTTPAHRLLSNQKREIQTLIRSNKEFNAVLTRLNSELQQQLQVVHQEKVTLETQLELRRPPASS